jgi:TPR repeat protein
MNPLTFTAICLLPMLTAHGAVSLDAKNESSVMLESDPAMKKVGKEDAETPAGKALQIFADGEHKKAVELAMPLADKGDPLALYIMGFASETGQGTEASPAKALEYYRKGAAANHPDSIYRLAAILISSGQKDRVEEGRQMLEKQAAIYPAVSGRILGEAFLTGALTGEPAPETAVSWWKKAAEAGDVPATFMLARFYDGQFGHASFRDAELAYDYFLKAAEKGDPASMVALGSRLLNGDVVKRDEQKGTGWLNKAIESKEFTAHLVLGDYFENEKKNLKSALSSYTLGAEAGQTDCMVRAAAFHLEGKGTDKDKGRGIELLEKAAKANNPQAHLMLAAQILGEEKADFTKGYTHLLSASNGGLALAQNELGLFYLSGKLGVADVPAAASWFTLAAKGGLASAQNNLATLYERGAGVEQSFDKAGQLYALAAQQESGSATLALARFHAAGLATKVNRELAWALANLAVERGEKENAEALIKEIEKDFSKEQLAAAKKELEKIKAEQPAEKAADKPADKPNKKPTE